MFLCWSSAFKPIPNGFEDQSKNLLQHCIIDYYGLDI